MKFKKSLLWAIGILTIAATACFARPSRDELFAACASRNPRHVQRLIDRGAYVNAKDRDGMTALMAAVVVNNNAEVTKILLRAGADVYAEDNDGVTALMLAAAANPNVEVIRALLRAGADINAQDDDGLTPLTWAVTANSNPRVAETLIKAGANVKLASREANLLQLLKENKKMSRRDRDWLWGIIYNRL